nr:hypothetical protein [uncultured Gellertiella sp.]
MKIADVGFVACRECWQCRETKIDDWVGRNIAESKFAKAAHVVTLTYGQDDKTGDRDHIRSAVLTYSDVQKYLKYLRSDGYPVRYFVVGEYGSKKGRAHWHIILYWQGPVPEHKIRENFLQKHWPHGWSYWDKCTSEAVRYACKYILKDPADHEKQGWGPMPSKKPPLGDAYFRDLAQRYVDQGLAPQHLRYSFPEVRRIPNGYRGRTAKQFRDAMRPVRFMMHGKTAENFISYFIYLWRERFGDEPPKSELIWAYESKRLGEYFESVAEPRFDRHVKGPVPKAPPFDGAKVQFSEKANCYYSDTASGRLWFSIDSEGDAVWHDTISPRVDETPTNRTTGMGDRVSMIRKTGPFTRSDPSTSRQSYRDHSKGL